MKLGWGDESLSACLAFLDTLSLIYIKSSEVIVLFRSGLHEFVLHYIRQRSSIPVINKIVITIYHPPCIIAINKEG